MGKTKEIWLLGELELVKDIIFKCYKPETYTYLDGVFKYYISLIFLI